MDIGNEEVVVQAATEMEAVADFMAAMKIETKAQHRCFNFQTVTIKK